MKSEEELTRKFVETLQLSKNPVFDVRKQFIKYAIIAGMEEGRAGYERVRDCLQTAMDNPFPDEDHSNTFDYLDVSDRNDGGFLW